MEAIVYTSLLLAGACKGIADSLQHHFHCTVFSYLNHEYWNPRVSWVYKWKTWNSREEKFWGSSRWFVWLTDGWHLVNFFQIKFIFIAVLCHTEFNWFDLIGILSYYLGFWITYESKLLRI